jgi:hypothetical protein
LVNEETALFFRSIRIVTDSNEVTDWTAFSLVMIRGSTSAANVNRTGYWLMHILCSP